MHRLLLCLPLALAMGSDRLEFEADSREPDRVVLADDGAALPKPAELERLAKENPLVILENALKRYSREVKGYTCTFQKQELIDGKLYPTEVIDVCFREDPHSVYFAWREGMRKAERVLYVSGANNDKLLIRPAGKGIRLIAGDIVSRDLDGPDARSSGRYTLKQFGMKLAAQRTYDEWKAAREDVQVEYLGIKKVKEAGDRPCYVLRGTLKKPDGNGISECTTYIDTETWLQVGSVLKGDKTSLLGAYYWRSIKLNPEFQKSQFERAALAP